jgi:branched-chain amino acid transport system permease protein
MQGGIYALVAVGITIIYGVMKMVNFAMGEFVTLGMYMTWLCYTLTGFSSYAVLPLVIVILAIAAWGIFHTTLKPLLGRGGTSFILMTFGLSFMIQNALMIIFSANSLVVASKIKNEALSLGSFVINYPKLIAFVVAFVCVIVLNQILSKTRLGRAMRATSENAEIAEMHGINSVRFFCISFIFGVILAGIAGLLLTPLYFVTTTTGATLKTTALMVVVLGGMGDIKGSFLGALMVGIVESVVACLAGAALGTASIFVLFLIVLYIRPQGLFGKGARVA